MIKIIDKQPHTKGVIFKIRIDFKEGVILHLDNEGLPLEIEILDASKLAMLKEISVMTSIGV
ncbi:MAG: hypothetical protein ACC630_02450 [Nitrospinota bacterium]